MAYSRRKIEQVKELTKSRHTQSEIEKTTGVKARTQRRWKREGYPMGRKVMNPGDETLEELYNLQKHEVKLRRVKTKSGKWLELFENPSIKEGIELGVRVKKVAHSKGYRIEVVFPEFTCLCPRTSQPDFATISIRYMPDKWCVELKSLKYYLNSFRNEGHFHEAVTNLIYDDLEEALKPIKLQIVGDFNVRGGTYPTITVGEWDT